jgi:hypothetical protein
MKSIYGVENNINVRLSIFKLTHSIFPLNNVCHCFETTKCQLSLNRVKFETPLRYMSCLDFLTKPFHLNQLLSLKKVHTATLQGLFIISHVKQILKCKAVARDHFHITNQWANNKRPKLNEASIPAT